MLNYNARDKGGLLIINEDSAIGDSAMVKLLLRNLISNAIKFSNKGDRVRIYSKTNNSNIKISVSDTGTGIPAEALPKLFRLDVSIQIRVLLMREAAELDWYCVKRF